MQFLQGVAWTSAADHSSESPAPASLHCSLLGGHTSTPLATHPLPPTQVHLPPGDPLSTEVLVGRVFYSSHSRTGKKTSPALPFLCFRNRFCSFKAFSVSSLQMFLYVCTSDHVCTCVSCWRGRIRCPRAAGRAASQPHGSQPQPSGGGRGCIPLTLPSGWLAAVTGQTSRVRNQTGSVQRLGSFSSDV